MILNHRVISISRSLKGKKESKKAIKADEDSIRRIEKMVVSNQESLEKMRHDFISHDVKSDHAQKRLEDKITNRNKKESRFELTQMDCAIIIAKKRRSINKTKADLRKNLKIEPDAIKEINDSDEKDEFKKIKNIARTIERWDTGKTRPPAGYSRRISEYEFTQWVEKRENRKFNNWKVRVLKRLRPVSIDTLSEEALNELMKQDRENNDSQDSII